MNVIQPSLIEVEVSPMEMRGFYVTDLKRTVLGLLVEYNFLTVTDFYDLCGFTDETSQRYLRDVLLLMSVGREGQRGYRLLDRHEVKDPVKHRGRWRHYEYMYWMTTKGYELACTLELDPGNIGMGKHSPPPPKPSYLRKPAHQKRGNPCRSSSVPTTRTTRPGSWPMQSSTSETVRWKA
jgi:hypothetical protein